MRAGVTVDTWRLQNLPVTCLLSPPVGPHAPFPDTRTPTCPSPDLTVHWRERWWWERYSQVATVNLTSHLCGDLFSHLGGCTACAAHQAQIHPGRWDGTDHGESTGLLYTSHTCCSSHTPHSLSSTLRQRDTNMSHRIIVPLHHRRPHCMHNNTYCTHSLHYAGQCLTCAFSQCCVCHQSIWTAVFTFAPQQEVTRVTMCAEIFTETGSAVVLTPCRPMEMIFGQHRVTTLLFVLFSQHWL